MTFIAFLLVFLSVFLHIAWNMLSKSSKPSLAFYIIMTATSSLVWLPFFILAPWKLTDLPWQFFVIMLFSFAGDVFYLLGLAHAYRKADISLVYPVVRALPVLTVAAATIIFGLGKTPGLIALAGMGLISVGCLIMPLNRFSDFSLKPYCSPVIGFILLAAAGTTMYTILDSHALQMIRDVMHRVSVLDTLGFLFVVEFGESVLLLFCILCSPLERKLLKKMAFRSIYPVIAGVCSSSAYGLVLMAMAFVTNVSYIQAFRQISLPIGFLAGVIFFREKGTLPKVTGMILIVPGLVCTALG